MAIRSPIPLPKTEYGKGNTDCHGHKCPRNDVGEFTPVRLHMGLRESCTASAQI